jgi:hypothetical protein
MTVAIGLLQICLNFGMVETMASLSCGDLASNPQGAAAINQRYQLLLTN